MNKFVWINPVVLSQYDMEELHTSIEEKGYKIAVCKKDHLQVVKDKYWQSTRESNLCIADKRCPAAEIYVKNKYGEDNIKFPEIYPILIHCAIELSERYEEEECQLYITTPCEELRNLGNTLKLQNTIFLTWNEFAQNNKLVLNKIDIASSPIPPGFFSSFGEDSISLKSKEEIDYFFQKEEWKDNKVAEMLYCKNGCHNGNGV